MNLLLAIALLSILFELVTIYCRKQVGEAKDFWKRRNCIHIHHSYLGLVFLLIYALSGNNVFLAIGAALVISDLFHHVVMLPLVLK